MSSIKIALLKIQGANLKSELFSQSLTQSEISIQLENGLKDLKKLVSLYILDKKGDYRIEIGDKKFNFVGNKFASGLTQVLNMVAASEMHKVGRGAELKSIQNLAEILETNVQINPDLLDTLDKADKTLEGNQIAFGQLSKKFMVEFESENLVKIQIEPSTENTENNEATE